MSDNLNTKYRPDCFEDVIGHEQVIKSLESLIERGEGNVFLFTGPSGVGKTTLARILANSVGANATDIQEHDAATTTGADHWRKVAAQSKYVPTRGDSTAIIVDECHHISPVAWTSLLKDLEDGPDHCHWVFCTTTPGKIPKAVMTRAHTFALRPVARRKIEELLLWVLEQEGHDVPGEVLDAILRHSEGSPRQALSSLSSCWDLEDVTDIGAFLITADSNPQVRELCQSLFAGRFNWKTTMKLVSEMAETPESVRIIIERYATAVALKAGGQKLRRAFDVLEAFGVPYPSTASKGSLILSIEAMASEKDLPQA